MKKCNESIMRAARTGKNKANNLIQNDSLKCKRFQQPNKTT